MPTYEYSCKKCGQSLEVFQRFADRPLKKHVDCGGELKKVLHASGIVFKGSGFYATDKRGSESTKAPSTPSEGTTDKPKKAKESPKADKTPTPAAD